MMSTTHAGMGATLAVLLVPIAPEFAATAAIAAFIGGIFPDLDVVLEHRKTLHSHEHYAVLAALAGAVAIAEPTTWTVGLTAFLASAALHSITDVFGGGLGLRPWVDDDDRGVYFHRKGRWIPPRRWVRYDGAPEDLVAAALFAVVPFLVFDGMVETILVIGVAVSALYVALRKRLPDIYERLVA